MAEEKEKKKRLGFKEYDPSKYVDVEPTLDEAKGGTAVITFGRMNPVTVGHEKLVNKLVQVAARAKGVPLVYLSHSEDARKNPLSYNDKILFAKRAFGKVIQKSKARTIIEVAKELSGKFSNLIVVVGSDRVAEFESLLKKYNGKEYNYTVIDVQSAGERDPDADGVEGMSASKMRSLAADNDLNQFKKGLPKKLQRSAADVLSAVRQGMNMSEETELDEALTRAERRKRSIAMRRHRVKIQMGQKRARRRKATTDKLKKRAQKRAIESLKQRFAKHKRYADMEPAEKERIEKKIERIPKARIEKIAKRMLIQVKKDERERFSNMAKDNPQTPQREEVQNEWVGPAIQAAKAGVKKYGGKAAKAIITSKAARKAAMKALGKGGMAAVGAAGASTVVGAAKAAGLAGKGVGFVAGKAAGGRREVREGFVEFLEAKMTNPQDPDIDHMPGTQPKPYYKGVKKDKKDDRARHFKRNAKKADDDPSAYRPAPGDKEAKTKESQHTKKFRQMYGEDKNSVNAEDEWVCGKCYADPCLCGDLTEASYQPFSQMLKRPHMLMDKNMKPKIDMRFKMYRKKHNALGEEVQDLSEAEALMEATENYILGENEEGLKNKAKKSGMPLGILRKVYNRGVAAWKGGHRPGTNPQQWGMARVNSFVTKSSGTWGKADADLAAKVRGSSKKEELDEVLDTPERMRAFKNKAKTQADRARNSATAKIVRGDGDYSQEKEILRRRMKTQDRIDRATNRQFRKSIGLGYSSKKEETIEEAATPQMKQAAASIEAYAKKHGGIDKADFMKAAKMLSSGNAGTKFIKFVDDLDTEPREWIVTNLAKTMGKKTVEKMFKVKIREEVEQLDELSPRTKASYLKKASDQNKKVQKAYDKSVKSSPDAFFGDDSPKDQERMKTMTKRQKGMAMAKGRKYGQAYESNYDKEYKHHSQGLKNAEADMKAAKTNDDMVKAMNKKRHHSKALSKMDRMDESPMNMRNMKLISNIKKSGVVKSGSMAKEEPKPKKESLDDQFQAFLDEKLKKSDDMGTWIKDFYNSDAPQFKGKSKDERRKMAIAAKLSANESLDDKFEAYMRSKEDPTEYEKERRKAIEKAKKTVNTEPSLDEYAGEEGTDKLRKKYKKDTPGA